MTQNVLWWGYFDEILIMFTICDSNQKNFDSLQEKKQFWSQKKDFHNLNKNKVTFQHQFFTEIRTASKQDLQSYNTKQKYHIYDIDKKIGELFSRNKIVSSFLIIVKTLK